MEQGLLQNDRKFQLVTQICHNNNNTLNPVPFASFPHSSRLTCVNYLVVTLSCGLTPTNVENKRLSNMVKGKFEFYILFQRRAYAFLMRDLERPCVSDRLTCIWTPPWPLSTCVTTANSVTTSSLGF